MNREINWTKVVIIILLWVIGGIFVPLAIITFLWMMLTNTRWSDTYLGELCNIWE